MGFFAKPYGAGFLFIRSGFLVVPRARKMFLITSAGLLDSLPGLAWKGEKFLWRKWGVVVIIERLYTETQALSKDDDL